MSSCLDLRLTASSDQRVFTANGKKAGDAPSNCCGFSKGCHAGVKTFDKDVNKSELLELVASHMSSVRW